MIIHLELQNTHTNIVAEHQRRRKQNRKLAKNLDELKKFTWRLFAQITSIHGLIYMFGKRNVKTQDRVLWSFIFTVCLILCLYQCITSAFVYYKFEIRETTTHDVIRRSKLKFPQIIICNKHPFRLASFCKSEITRFALAMLSTTTRAEASAIVDQMKSFCDPKKFSRPNISNQDNFGDFFDISEDYAKQWQLGYEDMARMCWWQNQKTPCSEIFEDFYRADNTKCFTFDSRYFEKFDWSNVKELSRYIPYKDEIKANGTGPRNGLKVFLYDHQQWHCDMRQKWGGTGFEIYVTLQDNRAIYPTDPAVYLSPGYAYEVAITPTITTRRTEHLNKCTDKVNIIRFSDNATIMDGSCYSTCFMKLLWTNCKCFLPDFSDVAVEFSKYLGTKLSDRIGPCSASSIQCAFDVLNKLSHDPLAKVCPGCKIPCYSEEYKLQITQSSYPQLKKISVGPDTDIYYSYKDAKKNFLVVNFFFKNYDVITVEERQDLDTTDLFINYFGNAISLLLGMSFISPFEVVFQLFVFLRYKLYRGRKST